MDRLFYILLSIALTGCASGSFSAKRDLDDSGKQEGIVITCSGGYKRWADCDQSAAKTCPNGYEIISKEENWVMQARTLRITCR